MKKISTLILFAIFLTLILTGCGNEAGVPDGMKALESSDELAYNLYIPESWTQDLSTGAVSAYSGKDDMANISMTTYEIEEAGKALSVICDEYVEKLKETVGEFEYCEGSPSNITFGNTPAEKIEYNASLTGEQYKLMQIFCAKNGRLYIFTYTSISDKYDEHKEEVQSMIDNFEFR